MRNCILVLVLFVLLSCNAQTKIMKYQGLFPDKGGIVMRKKIYYMEIPTGGKVDKRGTLTGDYHREYRVIYPDSSIIYITNDEWSGSSLNFDNRLALGISGYTKQNLLDSISNGGRQTDGKYWSEQILGDIVVGYINVPESKKGAYDVFLTTIRPKK